MAYEFLNQAVPTIQRETCTDCGACARVCATVLAMEDGKVRIGKRTFMGCIGCGQCMTVCPSGSITVTGRRFASSDVVDLPPHAERATPEQLDALLLARRSVRRFDPREVERAVVDRILAMTCTAPMGIPPSEVGILVFHGREKVRQFVADSMTVFRGMQAVFRPFVLALMRPFIGKANYLVMRDFVGPLVEEILKRWNQGEDVYCYDAPLALLFHFPPIADATDCHIATTYAMLAAQSFGLGSCMIGTAVALGRDKRFKAKYGIPPENKTGLALVIGHAAVSYRRGIRRQLASVRFA